MKNNKAFTVIESLLALVLIGAAVFSVWFALDNRDKDLATVGNDIDVSQKASDGEDLGIIVNNNDEAEGLKQQLNDSNDKVEELEQELDEINEANSEVTEKILKRARDTERQTDINGIHTQLEVFFTNNGRYPSFSELNSQSLIGIDSAAFEDPSGNLIQSGADIGDTGYYYLSVPTDCGGVNSSCTSYILSSTSEQDSSIVYEKQSFN